MRIRLVLPRVFDFRHWQWHAFHNCSGLRVKIVIVIVPETNQAVAQLLSGDIDYLEKATLAERNYREHMEKQSRADARAEAKKREGE